MTVAAARLERPGWLNVRTTLGLTLFVISLLAGWRVLSSADGSYPVWSVSSDKPEGAVLTAGDLRAVRVDLPPEQLRRYLAVDAIVEGATLLRPIRAGELLTASAVTDAEGPTQARLITIPVTADHAAGGALAPGDRVDIFASLAAGRPGARTTLLVAGAEVEDLVRGAGFVADEASLAAVTVEVSPHDAARVAFAVRSAEIDVVRIVGDPSGVSIDPVTKADL